jgi:hypothetical protein
MSLVKLVAFAAFAELAVSNCDLQGVSIYQCYVALAVAK